MIDGGRGDALEAVADVAVVVDKKKLNGENSSRVLVVRGAVERRGVSSWQG